MSNQFATMPGFFFVAAIVTLAGCERNSTSHPSTARLPAELRLFSWNLHRCEAGVERIEAELISQRPDILFLQEAEVLNDPNASRELLTRLAKALGGFEIVSAQTLSLPTDQHCDVAILSRWPIRPVAAHALDSKGWVYAIEGVVETNLGDLSLMSVHTHATWRLTDSDHVRESTSVRRRQIDGIISRARRLSHSVIVAGDFNAPAGTVEAGTLDSSLVDLALTRDRKPTTPAMLPILRLDYIFSNQPGGSKSYDTVEVNLSDHRPVKSTIAWPIQRPS